MLTIVTRSLVWHITRILYCVKSVQIRSYFWSLFSRIRTRNNSVFGHFTRSATSASERYNSHKRFSIKIPQMEFCHKNKFCLKLDALQVYLSLQFNYSRNWSKSSRVTKQKKMKTNYNKYPDNTGTIKSQVP